MGEVDPTVKKDGKIKRQCIRGLEKVWTEVMCGGKKAFMVLGYRRAE